MASPPTDLDTDRDARRRVLDLVRFDSRFSVGEQCLIRLLAAFISDTTGSGFCDLTTEQIARSLDWGRQTVEQAILQGVISRVIAHQPIGRNLHQLAIDWERVYDLCDWNQVQPVLKTSAHFSNSTEDSHEA